MEEMHQNNKMRWKIDLRDVRLEKISGEREERWFAERPE